jgi:hypothetical protein
MKKIARERVERAARIYANNKDAGAALGVTPSSFARLCRQYGIQTPFVRRFGAWRPAQREGYRHSAGG